MTGDPMPGTVHSEQPLALHTRIGSISDGDTELELLIALPLHTPIIVHPDGRTWTLNWEQLAEMAYASFNYDKVLEIAKEAPCHE